MTIREVTLHAFFSAKGGVGKSTLAVACARLLAENGRPCVLIDADLSGTSLAEGLHLRAPDLPLQRNGTLDLLAAPSAERPYHDLRKTWALLDQRKDEADGRPICVPLLNDALLYQGEAPDHDCRIDSMLWRHQKDDGVLYLPSSTAQRDVALALGWLYRLDEPYSWIRRMAWILDELLERLASLHDVVLDLPPGRAGFSREVLMLMAHLSRPAQHPLPSWYPDWPGRGVCLRVNPFLVATEDRNDLFATLEHYRRSRAEVPELRVLLNRSTEGRLRERVKERFARNPEYAGLEEEEHYIVVDEQRATLGRIFRDGVLRLDASVRRLHGLLRLGR